jgi:hypothetical protein
MRIGIISHTQKETDRPERYVSKNAAAALVRRLQAVYVTRRLIRMLPAHHTRQTLPNRLQTRACGITEPIQHHIEPKIVQLTVANSEWLRYIQGVR